MLRSPHTKVCKHNNQLNITKWEIQHTSTFYTW